MSEENVNIIFIGDPHFQVTNIKEINIFIDKLCLEIKKREVDIIIIAGDLLHSHEKLHTIALNKAFEFIKRLRQIKKTYILVGNHDMINNQQFLSENHWMNSIKEWENIKVVDKVICEKIKNKKFIFVPYVFTGRFKEALNTLDTEWKDAKCIFAHQEFKGCKMGSIISIDGDNWNIKEDPYVISGHIHSKQTPQENIYYPGASMQQAFGESDENIIAYLKFNNENKYLLEEINLGLSRKRIIYLDSEELDDIEIPETKDKIKLTISGNSEEFKQFKKTKKYKKILEKGIKINFKQKKKELLKKTELQNKIINDKDINFNFTKILEVLVNEEKNPKINEIFELIINNKKINHEDLIFL